MLRLRFIKGISKNAAVFLCLCDYWPESWKVRRAVRAATAAKTAIPAKLSSLETEIGHFSGIGGPQWPCMAYVANSEPEQGGQRVWKAVYR